MAIRIALRLIPYNRLPASPRAPSLCSMHGGGERAQVGECRRTHVEQRRAKPIQDCRQPRRENIYPAWAMLLARAPAVGCMIASQVPTMSVNAASTEMAVAHVLASVRRGDGEDSATAPQKPPTLGPTDIKAVATVGAPSYTSRRPRDGTGLQRA